jgi:predicted amidohydrolase YtcJ
MTAAALTACSRQPQPDAADIVLLGGGIYTVDNARSWTEAAAIQDGVIVAVGSNEHVRRYVGDDTEVVDLSGRMAMPGIHDSHIHPLEGGYEQVYCDITAADSVDRIIGRLTVCAKNLEGEWLNAVGLNWSLFDINGPDNSILDGIADERFIFVDGVDGHSALVNDKALRLAGIDANTDDPPRGVIERRDGSREPSGTLREAARDLVERLRPPRDLATSTAAMRGAMQLLNAHGITSVVDVWVSEHEMQVYQALEQSGDLTVRVVGGIIDEGVFEKDTGEKFERVLRERAQYESGLTRYNTLKIMVDGVVEGETAALLEPYTNVDHLGILNHSTEELRSRVQRYYDAGMQLHFHTMGDGAARAALDALEFARQNGDPRHLELRHTLSHLGLIDPTDFPRFAELNAGASFTLAWGTTDEWTYQLEIPSIGKERVRRLYPIRSVAEAGGVVLGGSDWNYGDLDPLISIEVGITRDDPYGPDSAGEFKVFDDETVDLKTLIDAYTINGAWQIHAEEAAGSIEPGKYADLVVYDRNLFEIDPYEISEAQVDLTIFNGQVVYRRVDD